MAMERKMQRKSHRFKLERVSTWKDIFVSRKHNSGTDRRRKLVLEKSRSGCEEVSRGVGRFSVRRGCLRRVEGQKNQDA